MSNLIFYNLYLDTIKNYIPLTNIKTRKKKTIKKFFAHKRKFSKYRKNVEKTKSNIDPRTNANIDSSFFFLFFFFLIFFVTRLVYSGRLARGFWRRETPELPVTVTKIRGQIVPGVSFLERNKNKNRKQKDRNKQERANAEDTIQYRQSILLIP